MASRPPEDASAAPDQARNRWFLLHMSRLMGVGLVVVGLLMSQGAIDFAGEANRLVGYALVVFGLIDAFVVPQVLARRWRTPPP